MFRDLPERARAEAWRMIEYCVPILTDRVHSVAFKYPRLTRIFQDVLRNRRIVPRRSMHLLPYFIPFIATAVEVSLGKEKVREYETAAQIYRQMLVDYLKQDMAVLTSRRSQWTR
jgi:hypothetical protein